MKNGNNMSRKEAVLVVFIMTAFDVFWDIFVTGDIRNSDFDMNIIKKT